MPPIGISPLPTIISPGDQGDRGPIGPRLIYFGASGNTFTTTRAYYQPYSTDFNISTTIIEIVNNVDGYLANLFFRVNSNAADSDATIAVFKNGVITALQCVLPAGSTSIVSDTTHQITVAPGDRIALSSTRGPGTFGIGFGKCSGTFERVAT